MDAVEALRPLLPIWVGLAPPLIWLPAALAIAIGTAGLAWRIAIVPFRALPATSSWVERARASQPARMALGFAALVPMALLGVLALRVGGPLSASPQLGLALAVGAAGYLGGLLVRAQSCRELGQGPGRALACASDDLVASLLLLPHLLVALCIAPWIRAPFEPIDAVLLGATALLLACIARGGALRVLARLGRVHPAPDRLRRAVREAAGVLGVPEPPVEMVDWNTANAFAFPLAARLVFSRRCVEVLADAELAAIASHELGHLSEPLSMRVARGAAGFAPLPLAGVVAALESAGLPGAIGVLGLVLALLLLFRVLASRMERRADHVALHGERSPGSYARALERLYETNLMPAVASGRPLHSHLYDRMLAAGVEPAYPRPDPPSAGRMRAALALSIAWLVITATVLAGLPILWRVAAIEHEGASNLVIALEPGSDALLRRALLEEYRGREAGALAFARAAAVLSPERHEPLALVAMALGRGGRCAEAAEQLAQALPRAPAGPDDPWVVSARASVEACAAPAPRIRSARSPA